MNREQWTKKLARIVADIESGKTPAPVRELYVFGTYARGALECKDLDLVVVHEEPPTELMEDLKKKAEATARSYLEALAGNQSRFKALMGKALRRPGEDMDILMGSDLAAILKGRAIEQSDLRLVWSSDDRDWQMKLQAIPLDAQAGSAPRDQFMSPKLAQAGEEDVKCVTTLLREQALTLTRIATNTLEVEELSEEWKAHCDRRRWGKKLQTLIPFAFAWVAGQKMDCIDIREHGEIWHPERHVRIQLGRLYLYWMVHLFQDQLKLRTQCLIPYFRRMYAKELFVFERGPAWDSRTDPWRGSKPAEVRHD
jgi:predicted nucleotidyltransferase